MNAKGGSNSGCRPSLALQGRHNNGQGVSPILCYVALAGLRRNDNHYCYHPWRSFF